MSARVATAGLARIFASYTKLGHVVTQRPDRSGVGTGCHRFKLGMLRQICTINAPTQTRSRSEGWRQEVTRGVVELCKYDLTAQPEKLYELTNDTGRGRIGRYYPATARSESPHSAQPLHLCPAPKPLAKKRGKIQDAVLDFET